MLPAQPSRTRYLLLVFLCALTFVLYIDRVCIAQAVEPIQAELGLSNTQMSLVLMAFTLAYGIFEMPVGRWGDRVGSRLVLTRIALWWSGFTALTAACTGFGTLLLIRFLFGAGEAGAMPNVARIVTRWYPASERGFIQGLIQTGALVGGAVAPFVAAALIHGLVWRERVLVHGIGWRGAFVLFGGLGVVWALAFWWWFRDDPAQHRGVNPGELELIGAGSARELTHEPIPWESVLTNRSMWTLASIIICGAFNSYLYFSWFPKYLQSGRGVDPIESGWLSSLVLAGAAVGTLLGGFLDERVRRSGSARARRWVGATGYGSAAGFIALGMLCESPRLMAVCAGLSCLGAMSTLSSWWSCAREISGRHLGALFGLMNGLGVFGAMGSQFFFGAFADWRKGRGFVGRDQYDPAFYVYVVVLAVASLLWMTYVSIPVQQDEEKDNGRRTRDEGEPTTKSEDKAPKASENIVRGEDVSGYS